jgi:hypothetical protein
MKRVRRISTVLAISMFALAVTAAAASATTIRSGSSTGSPYTGSVSGSALGNSLLESGFVDVTCTGSTLSGDITNSNGTGDIDSASWSGCTSNLGGTCTVTANNLSWGVTATKVNGQNWDGTFKASSVSATVACSGTSVGSFTCTYRGSGTGDSVTGNLYNPDNANRPNSTSDAQVDFIDEGLTKTGGSFTCSSTATWTALYKINGASNADLWITS